MLAGLSWQEFSLVMIATCMVFYDLGEDRVVQCSTTLNCSSSKMFNTSARDCCVNIPDGLSYSIPGKEECFQCKGW